LIADTPEKEIVAVGKASFECLRCPQHKTAKLFTCFKMHLSSLVYGQEMAIKAANDSQYHLPLRLVVSRLLKGFKEEALKQINQQMGSQSGGIEADELRWVVTIPAIWTPAAKQLMELAATDAGLPSDVLFALEPEAAALSAVEDDSSSSSFSSSLSSSSPSILHPDSLSLVADCGGGTIDITILQGSVGGGGTAKEVYPASGSDWGSTRINFQILEIIEAVSGPVAWERVCQPKRYREYKYLEEEVEKLKLSAEGEGIVQLPRSLLDADHENTIKNYNEEFGFNIELDGDDLFFPREDMEKICSVQIGKIVKHIQSLLSAHPNIRTLFLVGGFADDTRFV
jgi:hypothetical protein